MIVMDTPIRLSNRSEYRVYALSGSLAIALGGALLLLTIAYPDVFVALNNRELAQVAGFGLVAVGLVVIGFLAIRINLSIEFGEQICVRRVWGDRVISWHEIASLELIKHSDEVRPFEHFGSLPAGIGEIASATGATNLARFTLTTRRVHLRLKDGTAYRCDVRMLEFEQVTAIATEHGVPVSVA